MKLTKKQEVALGDSKYIYYIDNNGKEVLKTYDQEYKMWVSLSFASADSESENDLVSALSNEYLRSFN